MKEKIKSIITFLGIMLIIGVNLSLILGHLPNIFSFKELDNDFINENIIGEKLEIKDNLIDDKSDEIKVDNTKNNVNKENSTSNQNTLSKENNTLNKTTNKQIYVKNGVLYDEKSKKEFHIIGINFDNNTWNPNITAINTGHNETSYKELSALGFNTIRFGIAYNMTLQDNFFEWLDINISQAEQAGLKIILDMHTTQGGIQLREKDKAYEFWQSEQLQTQFIETWVKIAKRYNNNNTVIMYDLLNEPLVIIDEGQNADTLYYNFISKLVNSIRNVDKQTIICIEGYNSSILKYKENYNEKNYTANITNSSQTIKKIKDNNIVYDVHTYSPTEYTFQTEKSPISYDDLYSVKDRGNWLENSDYYIIKTDTANKWFLYESDLYKITNEKTNYGNIRYTYDKESINSSIWFDKIIVEEYDENMQFIKNVYDFSFNKTKYKWNIYGTQNYEIDNTGYDNIGGALKLTSNNESSVLTLRIDNTGFDVKVGNYYKVKAYIKSSSILSDKNARISLIFAYAGYTGGLKEMADYNFSKYKKFSSQTNIPMICNEFGTNYNSIKNSDGDKYLYNILTAAYKYKVNISLFSYSGFDFGLMYDNSRDFGTEKSNIRQDSYDALYKAINQDDKYEHIFKNIETMKKYSKTKSGDKVLVLGETLAGLGPKIEYNIVDYNTSGAIELSNGLYAIKQ